MRPVPYASAILTIILIALISTAGTLLLLSHEGSQRALQAETRITYTHDKKLLQRLINEQQIATRRLAEEVASRNDIRSSLMANDLLTARMVLTESLQSSNGQMMDALVIEAKGISPVVINNTNLYGLDIPLQNYLTKQSSSRNWDTVDIEHAGSIYHFIRLQVPVISPLLGEVIGSIYTFVMLNDNYWLLSEALEVTGAQSLVLLTDGQILGEIESEEMPTSQLLMRNYHSDIESFDSGSGHKHSLLIGSKSYPLYLFKSGSSSQILSAAYNQYLWTGGVLVLVIGVSVMLLIRYLTRRSLMRLMEYAETAPNESRPAAYQNDCFIEFNMLGSQIEDMIRDIRAQENQLDSIFHHTPSAMFLKSPDYQYLMVNSKFPEMFSQDGSSVLGKTDFDIFPDIQAREILATDKQVIETKQSLQAEYSLSGNQGLRHYLTTKFPVLDDKGQVYAVGGITTDITDKVAAEREAAITNLVFEAAAEAILIMNPQGRVITNSAFSHITGYSNRNAKYFALSLLRDHPEIEAALQSEGRWQGESLRRRVNGEMLPIWMSISAIQKDSDQSSYVAVFSDISNLKEAERKLEKLAHYDNLTSLPNRTLFYDRFESALSRSARTGKQTALLFVDLDRFKHVNDNYGHHAGDEMLIEAAKRINSHIRPGDTVSRLGGDEFTTILADLDNSDRVQDIARRIQKELKLPFVLNGKEVFTSASIGIALYPDDGKDAQTLLKHADTAMYHVKEQGRNDIMFFDKALNAQAEERIQLEDSLRKAIKNDDLYLAYQPRFDISGGKVLSAEALIRWNHPERGPISPVDFIPLAESSGLIVELGKQVLNKACFAAQRWNKDSQEPVSVSVNLSARQLHDPNILSDIEAALSHSGLPASMLELEITETMVIQDMDAVISRLESIRELGVNLSVDDFGTGYSSLIYLKRLPVSTVKIDKSFIDDVPGTSDGENLIQAIISMSHSLNLRVVAEGVETRQQLEFLSRIHCDELQGYLLAKPDTAEKVEQLISGS